MYHSTRHRFKNQKPISQNPKRWAAAQSHCQRNISTTKRVSKEGKSRRKNWGKRQRNKGGGVCWKKSQRSIMNVQTETGSIACHYTAGFYYGAPAGGQSSSPSDSPQPLYPPLPPPALTCAKTAVFLTMRHVVVMIRPCVCVCVCGCVHTPHYPSLTRDCTPLRTRFFLFFPLPTQNLPGSSLQQKHGASRKRAGTSLSGFSLLSFILAHAAVQQQLVSGGEARARVSFLSSQQLTYPPKRCHFLCLLIT